MGNIVLVLHNVRSVYNVGSIFRTAESADVEKIFLCGVTPTPLDRFEKYRLQFVKVSLGAEKSVPWDGSARSPRSILKLLEKLKRDGYAIFAVEQSKKSVPYYKVKAKGKIALVFGNEMRGLPNSILKRADKILEIPMAGNKESLNVAVAAGIVLFRIRYP